jgi:hypothetical protein
MEAINLAIKDHVEAKMALRFPGLAIRWSTVDGDQAHLTVSVYGVENSLVSEVRSFVRDEAYSVSGDSDIVVTPIVKNLDATRKHFPEYLPIHSSEVACQRIVDVLSSINNECSSIARPALWEEWQAEFLRGFETTFAIQALPDEWQAEIFRGFETAFAAKACNEELALAA